MSVRLHNWISHVIISSFQWFRRAPHLLVRAAARSPPLYHPSLWLLLLRTYGNTREGSEWTWRGNLSAYHCGTLQCRWEIKEICIYWMFYLIVSIAGKPIFKGNLPAIILYLIKLLHCPEQHIKACLQVLERITAYVIKCCIKPLWLQKKLHKV